MCDKSFDGNRDHRHSDLKGHEKQKTGVKPLACPECDKNFEESKSANAAKAAGLNNFRCVTHTNVKRQLLSSVV